MKLFQWLKNVTFYIFRRTFFSINGIKGKIFGSFQWLKNVLQHFFSINGINEKYLDHSNDLKNVLQHFSQSMEWMKIKFGG